MEQQKVYSTAQEYLIQEGIPGWLVYDYRQANPVFWLVVSASGHVTRPCYFYLPAQGEPTLLIHHVDTGKFADSGVQEIFDIVIGARDAALHYLEDDYNQGNVVQGWQADQVARDYISSRGYGEYFTHRLGHSIGFEAHSEAVNLDGFETHDTRRIIPGICFSIEPGIYLPEFGVRSEIDVFMSAEGPFVSSPVQHEVVLIKGAL